MAGNYSLRMAALSGDKATIAHILDRLPGVRESWERTENRWGFSVGVFNIEGPGVTLEQLIGYQAQWLGHEVREELGDVLWEGYVHELRLYHQDICRVYGYDIGGRDGLAPAGMYNAVRVGITNLLENPGFETNGSGGNAFADWEQAIDNLDDIEAEDTDPARGSQSARLVNADGGNTYLRQAVTVQPKTTYRLTFTARSASDELVANGGFEQTGSPTFASWSENLSGGDTCTVETSSVHAGTRAAKLTNNGGGTNGIYQDIAVKPGQLYQLSMWVRGDGTRNGRFSILDNASALGDIIEPRETRISGTVYELITAEFTAPSECDEIRLYLHMPAAAGSAYYDSVGLTAVSPGRYRVVDKTNGVDVISMREIEGSLDGYRATNAEFVTPADCTELYVYLYAPLFTGECVFDEVKLQRVIEGSLAPEYTAWATQPQSIARHRRREITLDAGELTPSEAAGLRDSVLLARAWPQERQANGDGSTRLEVYCLGYIHQAGWLYADELAGQRDTISNHVAAIAANLPQVSATAVRDNSTPFTMPEAPQTYLKALQKLVEAGDSDGNMWRAFIDRGRQLIYEQVDFTPALSMAGGKLYERLGDREEVGGRLLRAMTVVRNFDFPDRTRPPGSLLLQRNDSLMESVTVGPRGLRREWATL